MIENILNKICSYNPEADVDTIIKAYNYAEKAHESAPKRLSGEKYFVHPYNVALILCELNMDVPTISAGLLHDVVEDTDITYEDIEDKFSTEIADLVDGVTKLSKVKYRNKEERQAESLRKMIIAMSKDFRVIIIKLADRLHNIRTLEYMPVHKQKQKALETLEIYAPIANRLGMASIKWELEDTSLKYIDRDGYEDLVVKVSEKNAERKELIKKIIDNLNAKLDEAKLVDVNITGRAKSLYSVYKKMYYRHKSFDEIYDLTAVRIIVYNIRDCYEALGIVHTMWKPIPGRFKDYIAMPKPNMYQSLHTTVIGPDGDPFEIQIRTLEMHRTAEFGIAAHWKYKEGITSNTVSEEKLNWIRQMIEWQKETQDPNEFMENLKMDLYADEVFVFSPKGEVMNLPKGSTPLDFAYRIHSQIGNKCVGAKINGRIVSLDYKLRNADKVEVLTSNNAKPSRDWLKLVASGQAKAKIKKFFKEKDKDINIERGRDLLEKESKRQGFIVSDILKEEYLKICVEKYNTKNIDNLYALVATGILTDSQIVNKIKLLYIEKNKDTLKEKELEKLIKKEQPVNQNKQSKRKSLGIMVKGVDNVKVRLSRCCNPVPGDEIVGFITRGRGVSVHRADCINLRDLSENNNNRFIEVEWDYNTKASFISEIQIVAEDKPRLLQQITMMYIDAKMNAISLNLRKNKDRNALIDITFEIDSADELNVLISKMKRIDGIIDIYRTNK